MVGIYIYVVYCQVGIGLVGFDIEKYGKGQKKLIWPNNLEYPIFMHNHKGGNQVRDCLRPSNCVEHYACLEQLQCAQFKSLTFQAAIQATFS